MVMGEKLLNRTPVAYPLRLRIVKSDHIKLRSFLKAKDTVNRTKWQPTD
jgi:phage-related protein